MQLSPQRVGVHVRGNSHGDNARLTGFRTQGPHWDSVDGDDNLEIGLKVESCIGIDISNMELSGWSGAAIRVGNSRR